MNKLVLFLMFLAVGFVSMAQKETFTGKLIDAATGKAISGATVFYHQQYSISDENGRFELRKKGTDRVKVMINHIGYESFESTISVTGKQELVIELKSSVKLLEEVLISSDSRPLVAQQRMDQKSIMRGNPKNVGDIFGDKSGFGIVKRGGYAMEPVFRSFKYEQLNLIYDGGVYLSPACPNRMDPASVQISPAEIDRIELIKGPYSVRYGQTMGGLINIITNEPVSSESFRINGALEGGYEVNGNGITGRGAISAVGEKYDFSVRGGVISFDDYKNGAGETIPSSFSTNNYAAKFGFNLVPNQRLQLGWRQSFGKDIKHVSLPMDSPKDNSSILTLDYGARNIAGKLASINAKAFYTFIDHLMTNEHRPNFKMVEVRAPVTSTTYGGRIELGLNTSEKSMLFAGTDFRYVGKDGERHRTVKIMNGNPVDPPKEFTDLIWQDSWLFDIGVFAETSFTLDENWDLLVGGRFDYIKSGINHPAPDFEALYGAIDPDPELNIGLTSSINYNFGHNGLVQLSLGRGQRSAELTERYINHFTVGMDAYEYVGNPNLKAEINNQADLTIKNAHDKFFWSLNVFYSFLQHYITAVVDASISRKYMPGTEPFYAKRFINIDKAWQTGFDAEIGYHFTANFSARAGGYYTRAQNVDFDEPLPEIPPLTGLISLKYDKEKYWAEFRGRFVADQEKVSESFKESETPGFNVFDLSAGYSPINTIDINLALTNIFNVNYYEHLSRPYKNQGENGMLYEPGRSLRVGLKVRF
ncbi:MAG: TonB-dependent receptor [Cytophagales bacterium]|nr:TonB-dependent receptor [Cytophagales bacterium]